MAKDSMKNLGFGTEKTETKEVRGEEVGNRSGGGDGLQQGKAG